MEKYIGKKLEGRYELIELIGFGGMAIVFKARDILENKFVAIKILKDEFLSNDDFKRRFRNESKAIAVLSHPSIVKIFDVNFSDNIQYIVMEYIDGITLKEYIGQQGTVKWKEAVHFTVQILRALQHAHDNGIVHRDVKPQNVMLLEDGTIKVMDFGIARFARETGKTLTDKAIGSVHYISPEQAKGETTDEKTDIYATGVIMYEMLTGKVPFDGETPVSIAIKQMQLEPQRPKDINPEIPTGLEEIILRAMQKDPQLRYPTASEMLLDIDEFKRNPSVVFEYKYFNKDGTTKYFNKIDSKGKSKTDKPQKKSYTMNILAGVTAACVLLAIVALVITFRGLNSKTSEVLLLNIVGMTVQEAQEKMPDVVIEVKENKLSTEYEKGLIIEQKPGEKQKVKVKSVVEVIVSEGLEKIIVPDLINEEAVTAKGRLEDLGFKVEQVSKTDDNITKGHVIETDPPADSELQKGDTVTIFVSKGSIQMPKLVPNLIGLTEVAAKSKLIQSELTLGKVVPVDSAEKLGTIIEQSSPPDSRVEKGTAIDIKVSNGSSPEKKLPIVIKFPKGDVSMEYTFNLYINGQYITAKTLNPSTGGPLTFDLEAKDGMVNGVVSELATNEIVIMVDGLNFASYNANFNSLTLNKTSGPDFSIVFPFGTTSSETQPEPSSTTSSKPSGNQSSTNSSRPSSAVSSDD